jgi:hypothetical protein
MKTTTILITFLSLFCSSTVTGQVLQRRYENQLEEFNRMKTRGIVCTPEVQGLSFVVQF